MVTLTINAAVTGYYGDGGYHPTYVGLEYHTGQYVASFYPYGKWSIATSFGGIIVEDAVLTPGGYETGTEFGTLTGSQLSFFRTVPNGDGSYTIEAVGTGSMPGFSAPYHLHVNSNQDGVDGYVDAPQFGKYLASLDVLFNGAEGDDTINGNYVSNVGRTATFLGAAGNDVISGSFYADNVIYAGADDDFVYVYGGHGAPMFEGDVAPGALEQFVDGGEGQDEIYLLGRSIDSATLHGGGGNDRIYVSGSSTNLLRGDAGDDLIGGDGDDTAVFSGKRSDYAIREEGGQVLVEDRRHLSPDGTDIVYGVTYLKFSDALYTVASLLNAGVTIHGTASSDTISPSKTVAGQPKASAANDTIYGNGGNDKLDGGGGADSLYGGAGNDTYYVDQAGDQAIELSAADGIDTVVSTSSFVLTEFVENLTLAGGNAADGTGNDLANKLVGNAQRNVISGLDGADNILGGDGDDDLYGDGGNDALAGGSGNDTLFGGTGADKLDGGTGHDIMWGGADNDTYIVDDSFDQVSEVDELTGLDAGGVDKVAASASYTLGSFVEHLTLTGSASIDGTGNDLANKIVGNSGNNVLTGGGGSDTLTGNDGNDDLRGGDGNDALNGGIGEDHLNGGAGVDKLAGGADADFFYFGAASAGNKDTITDFMSGSDKLVFSASDYGLVIGSGLNSDGTLSADFLQFGASATGDHGTFLYNSANRTLFWDPNGSGGAAATAIVTLQAGASLALDDFFL